TKTGYAFSSWNTVAGGTGTSFTSSTAVSASITVYAQWTINPTYTVTFDSQGGSAVAAITGINAGETVTLPAAPTQALYTFASWNTAADGSGTSFTSSTAVSASVTVYAQTGWQLPETSTQFYNLLFAGVILMFIGVAGLRKRKQNR
ncbi:MAG: InlB B-repeat-containing protein, partial [Clostridia bacterium]